MIKMEHNTNKNLLQLFQVTDCDGDEAVDLKIIVGVTVIPLPCYI